MGLGDRLRAAREERDWSQEYVAKLVKAAPRTIGNWERGATHPKSKLGKLRAIFGDEVIDGTASGLNDGRPPLAQWTDAMLLSELLRRALERERGDDSEG